jgi:hypothetical protein
MFKKWNEPKVSLVRGSIRTTFGWLRKANVSCGKKAVNDSFHSLRPSPHQKFVNVFQSDPFPELHRTRSFLSASEQFPFRSLSATLSNQKFFRNIAKFWQKNAESARQRSISSLSAPNVPFPNVWPFQLRSIRLLSGEKRTLNAPNFPHVYEPFPFCIISSLSAFTPSHSWRKIFLNYFLTAASRQIVPVPLPNGPTNVINSPFPPKSFIIVGHISPITQGQQNWYGIWWPQGHQLLKSGGPDQFFGGPRWPGWWPWYRLIFVCNFCIY